VEVVAFGQLSRHFRAFVCYDGGHVVTILYGLLCK
jgi:hypothetical protein